MKKDCINIFILSCMFCMGCTDDEIKKNNHVVGITDFTGSKERSVFWVNDEPVYFVKKAPSFPVFSGGYPLINGKNILKLTPIQEMEGAALEPSQYSFYYSLNDETTLLEVESIENRMLFAEVDIAKPISMAKSTEDSVAEDYAIEFLNHTMDILAALEAKDLSTLRGLFLDHISDPDLLSFFPYLSTDLKLLEVISESTDIRAVRGKRFVLIHAFSEDGEDKLLGKWLSGQVTHGLSFLLFRVDDSNNRYLYLKEDLWLKLSAN